MKDLAVENEFMSVVFLTVPALVHKIRKGPESNFGRRFHEMYFWVDICKYGIRLYLQNKKIPILRETLVKTQKIVIIMLGSKKGRYCLDQWAHAPTAHFLSRRAGRDSPCALELKQCSKKPLILTISIWTCISPLAHKAALHYKAANASGVGHVSSTHIFPTIDCMVPRH